MREKKKEKEGGDEIRTNVYGGEKKKNRMDKMK